MKNDIEKFKKYIKHGILVLSIWWILKTGDGFPLNRRSSNESLKNEISDK